MIYAYLRDGERVELYASEANKPAPTGFITCTLNRFMRAWRVRDALRMRRLAQTAQRSK